jgi:transposase
MTEKVISSTLEATREGEMINQDKWGAISSLLAQGVKKKAIARLLGLHIQTVRKWAAEGSWTPFRRPIRGKKLDPYQEWAKVRLPQIGYNAVVLQEELEAQGYTGSYQQVKRFVRPLREERDRLEAATVRYETAPGQQAQVDWGTAWVSLGGREVRVQFFVMVLGYSRRIFARATLDQKIPALLSCHEAAFEHFGGRTRDILYDNPKTIALERDGRLVRLNPVFEDFARYWGYSPRLCWPYRARTKGKVESGVKYVKRNFLAGKSFESLEHLNRELIRWCVETADRRVHGTTHRIPAETFLEEGLVPTAGHPPYRLVETPHRTVATDCLVTYETNRYSVPARLVGKTVEVVVTGSALSVYHRGARVAEHTLNPGRFQLIMEKAHYAELFKRRTEPPPQKGSPIHPWPEVEERSLAVYEDLACLEPLMAAGGAR